MACVAFRASKILDKGTFPADAKWEDSYCNERYDPADTCFPQSYAEMFNCLDNSGWAYTGIFCAMAFSILGAGL